MSEIDEYCMVSTVGFPYVGSLYRSNGNLYTDACSSLATWGQVTNGNGTISVEGGTEFKLSATADSGADSASILKLAFGPDLTTNYISVLVHQSNTVEAIGNSFFRVGVGYQAAVNDLVAYLRKTSVLFEDSGGATTYYHEGVTVENTSVWYDFVIDTATDTCKLIVNGYLIAEGIDCLGSNLVLAGRLSFFTLDYINDGNVLDVRIEEIRVGNATI